VSIEIIEKWFEITVKDTEESDTKVIKLLFKNLKDLRYLGVT
jgi:hypothetical protein